MSCSRALPAPVMPALQRIPSYPCLPRVSRRHQHRVSVRPPALRHARALFPVLPVLQRSRHTRALFLVIPVLATGISLPPAPSQRAASRPLSARALFRVLPALQKSRHTRACHGYLAVSRTSQRAASRPPSRPCPLPRPTRAPKIPSYPCLPRVSRCDWQRVSVPPPLRAGMVEAGAAAVRGVGAAHGEIPVASTGMTEKRARI